MFWRVNPHMLGGVKLGTRIRLLADVRGVRFGELADKAGVSRSAMDSWVSRGFGARPESLAALAKALEVVPAALTDDRECVLELARIVGVEVQLGKASAEELAIRALVSKAPDLGDWIVRRVELELELLTGRPPKAKFD
jgi:transcriptional regulator with XRE-family HTH domain